MTYQPDAACTRCSGIAQPGTVALIKYLMNRFPFVRSLGVYNCRPIAGSKSLSDHSCGRALDAGIPVFVDGSPQRSRGDQVVRLLDQYSTQFGIVEQIYARVMYDDASPRGRRYGGVHPHNDHVHAGMTLSVAKTLTYAKIEQIAGPANGDEVGALQVEELQTALNKMGAKDDAGAALKVDGVYGPKSEQAWIRGMKTGPASSGLTKEAADKLYSKKGHVHDEGSTGPG